MTTREEDVERAAQIIYEWRWPGADWATGTDSLKDEARACARKVLASLPPDDGMERAAKDISTAPRDTAILVYNSGWEKAHFNTAYGMWIGYGAETSDTVLLNLHPPTHWMPLPGAPTVLHSQPPQARAAMPSEGELREIAAEHFDLGQFRSFVTVMDEVVSFGRAVAERMKP